MDKWKLEGIVSKRADQPYRSGTNPGWVEIKTVSWREENKNRGELFQARPPKTRKGERWDACSDQQLTASASRRPTTIPNRAPLRS